MAAAAPTGPKCSGPGADTEEGFAGQDALAVGLEIRVQAALDAAWGVAVGMRTWVVRGGLTLGEPRRRRRSTIGAKNATIRTTPMASRSLPKTLLIHSVEAMISAK